jgi:hypothetical protein
MKQENSNVAGRWSILIPSMVFVCVTALQLWLVAVAGTDIPFYDQWTEVGDLYARWCDGSLRAIYLVQPANEHRILWSHLSNLGLFVLNGQWDPLAKLVIVAGVRGAFAAMIASMAGSGLTPRPRFFIAVGVTVAFLPILAWHSVLWGIELFVLEWAFLALWLLGTGTPSTGRTLGGLVAGGAALVAMGPGMLVPMVLLGLAALKAAELRKFDAVVWRLAWPAIILLAAGWLLRAPVPGHAGLAPATAGPFLSALVRMLSWPHDGQFATALLLNLPVLLVVVGRVLHRRQAAPGEDFVLLAAGWGVAIALATAWARGGGDELAVGVPSRYVDFLVFLPLANVWCVVALAREAAARWQSSARLVAAAWGVFLFAGWLALSAQVVRGIVLPRMHDREAPVRLTRAFQLSGDATIFAGQPRLLVPHPDPELVRAVLHDPRLQGRLPPSLQPERPMGPLSRAARRLLGR